MIAAEREAVREFLERVRRDLQPADASAVVFGSRVRGEAGPESDLDVLVALDRDDLPIRRRVFDLASEGFLATDVLISPLVISREGFAARTRSGRRIVRDIGRDGVPVG
ncbi:MAG: nucleotidyltransferase domain-containing protein [Candidatus Methylomirabilota bacterium]